MKLAKLLDLLETEHGRPPKPAATDPFGMILWENVAYLVDDSRRARAFARLADDVGLSADAILGAPDQVLLEVARLGGMHPERRLDKLRDIAALCVELGDDDLRSTLELEPARARRVFKKFPGIGDPGADKILLFAGIEPVLALDSNGLRVLLRLGYGKEHKSYASSYRSAREAAEPAVPATRAARMRAHWLLRRHGQVLCKTSRPLCAECPLRRTCPSAL